MQRNTIYLASKSPRRRELLKQIGVRFELLLMREQGARIDIDESSHANEAPADYVERIVRLKADAALRMMRDRRLTARPILSADTTVALDGRIFGKPADAAAAQEMLGALAGKRHQVITGIAVTWEGNILYQAAHSEVTFAAQSAAQIRRYVDSNEAMDKAGAYGIQGSAAMFITHLSGSYSGVMGLPLYETAVLLRQSGIEI